MFSPMMPLVFGVSSEARTFAHCCRVSLSGLADLDTGGP
jgi:hypothetical protein